MKKKNDEEKKQYNTDAINSKRDGKKSEKGRIDIKLFLQH